MSDSGNEAVESRTSDPLLKSSLVVSIMTMLSRVLGLARDIVIAYFFGSSAAADTFFLAFRIPNFFRRLFAEGAFSQAFIPVLSEYKQGGDRSALRSLLDHTAGTLGLALFIFTGLGMLCAAGVITVFAAGYVYQEETEKIYLATQMLRITFPYLLLISLTAFAGAILNTFGRFAVPAFTPVLLNLSVIGSAIWLRPYFDFPVLALAWGVLIAGFVQLAFQLPFLARLGLLPRLKVDFKHTGVRRILRLMVPAMFGVSVGQINLLLDTVLATFLITGSLSWLYYSDRLLELPLALFGITIATVILPALSKKFVEQSSEAFSETLDWAVKTVVLLGVPASVALIYLSDLLIATLFFHGAMTTLDIEMASLSLQAYGAGLTGHMLVKVLAPGYFARQDTATPVKIGLIALFFNMAMNLMLIVFLGHVGLALATSASAFLNAFLLWRGLRLKGIYQAAEGWVYFVCRLLLSVAAMAMFLIWVTPDLAQWLPLSSFDRVTALLVICILGALVYFLSMAALGMRFRDFRR